MLIAALSFVVLSAPAHLETKSDELVALQAKRQHAELLQRAVDVNPKARDKKWEKIVTKSALEVSVDDAQRSPLDAYDKELDRARAFPHLLDDTNYRVQYERVLRDSTKACLVRAAALARNRRGPLPVDAMTLDVCIRRGDRLISDKRTSWKTLHALAGILWRGGDKEGAARSIEATLARQKKSQRQPVCESEQTETVVENAFRQPHDSRHAGAGRRVAFEFCEAVFRDEIVKELARDPRQEVYDNACPALLRNPKAGKLLKKRCKRSQAS